MWIKFSDVEPAAYDWVHLEPEWAYRGPVLHVLDTEGNDWIVESGEFQSERKRLVAWQRFVDDRDGSVYPSETALLMHRKRT
jgi:hypothetical protein